MKVAKEYTILWKKTHLPELPILVLNEGTDLITFSLLPIFPFFTILCFYKSEKSSQTVEIYKCLDDSDVPSTAVLVYSKNPQS